MKMGLCATRMLKGRRSMRAMVSERPRMQRIVAVVVYEFLELSFGLM